MNIQTETNDLDLINKKVEDQMKAACHNDKIMINNNNNNFFEISTSCYTFTHM